MPGTWRDTDKDADSFQIKTSDNREFTVTFAANANAWIANNLNEPRQWCTEQMRGMLTRDASCSSTALTITRTAASISLRNTSCSWPPKAGEYGFEKPNWWIRQIQALGDFYLRAQFGGKEVNYDNYRTVIKVTGEKDQDNYRQETDTISRLVYGFASAYMLTGDDRYLEGAEKGTEYLREHLALRRPR